MSPIKEFIPEQKLCIIHYFVLITMKSEPRKIKILTVGDGAVGKNCIVSVMATDQFPTEYGPVVMKEYAKGIRAGEESVILQLNTVSGQEQFLKMQQLCIAQSEVILVVFSVVEPYSFINALKKWIPDLEKQSPHTLKIIVGSKTDLRKQYTQKIKNAKQMPVTEQFARQKIRQQFKDRYKYFECSALNREGLDNILNYIIGEYLNAVKNKQSGKTDTSCQLF